MHEDALKSWNKRLEKALGTTPVEGREFPGWRRRRSDAYDRWTTNKRVKDMLMGHQQVHVNFQGGSTREVVYLDAHDETVTAEAIRLLAHARTTWARTGEAPPVGG